MRAQTTHKSIQRTSPHRTYLAEHGSIHQQQDASLHRELWNGRLYFDRYVFVQPLEQFLAALDAPLSPHASFSSLSYLFVFSRLGHGLASFYHFRNNDRAALSIELVEVFVMHVQDGVVQTNELFGNLKNPASVHGIALRGRGRSLCLHAVPCLRLGGYAENKPRKSMQASCSVSEGRYGCRTLSEEMLFFRGRRALK